MNSKELDSYLAELKKQKDIFNFRDKYPDIPESLQKVNIFEFDEKLTELGIPIDGFFTNEDAKDILIEKYRAEIAKPDFETKSTQVKTYEHAQETTDLKVLGKLLKAKKEKFERVCMHHIDYTNPLIMPKKYFINKMMEIQGLKKNRLMTNENHIEVKKWFKKRKTNFEKGNTEAQKFFSDLKEEKKHFVPPDYQDFLFSNIQKSRKVFDYGICHRDIKVNFTDFKHNYFPDYES